MEEEERLEMEKRHWDTLATEADYKHIVAYDLRDIVPLWTGSVAANCRYAGESNSTHLSLITGGGLGVLVETRSFLFLFNRFPKASWRFGCHRPGAGGYWTCPVVLLEDEGFSKGKMLGILAPVPVRPDKFPFRGSSEGCLKRTTQGNQFKFVPEGEKK
jgi:hypothetical protein